MQGNAFNSTSTFISSSVDFFDGQLRKHPSFDLLTSYRWSCWPEGFSKTGHQQTSKRTLPGLQWTTENRELSKRQLVVPEVVIMTTEGAIHDNEVGIMKTLGLQWTHSIHISVTKQTNFLWRRNLLLYYQQICPRQVITLCWVLILTSADIPVDIAAFTKEQKT